MAKIPDYITTEDCRVNIGQTLEENTLPAGTFVKPIEPYYLPPHIKSTDDYRWLDSDIEVFVYCSKGIVKIRKDILRKV